MRPIILAGVLLLATATGGPATAESHGIVLDGLRRAALVELPRLVRLALREEDLTDRVVVIGFFASWCPPCRPEFETLNEIRKEFADEGVEVLAVNIFENLFEKNAEQRLTAFLIETSPRFKVLGDGDGVGELFGPVTRIPTTFVFGRDGRPTLHFVHLKGAGKTHASLEELRAAVRGAL
jgi:thiol-disulfide isomerase/thioredoxin